MKGCWISFSLKSYEMSTPLADLMKIPRIPFWLGFDSEMNKLTFIILESVFYFNLQ